MSLMQSTSTATSSILNPNIHRFIIYLLMSKVFCIKDPTRRPTLSPDGNLLLLSHPLLAAKFF